ncbi:MAG: transporter substrate-binding domain-containing protein [SAR324 cluster bacterium]|nr:transporter substrate-binding domain-containing protein [SAR324 cluster bacterium]
MYEETLLFTKFLGKGVQPKYTHIQWSDQFKNKQGKIIHDGEYTPQYLASGECDIYPNNLTKNDWRLKKMDFVMLFPSRMMVIVHKSERIKYHKPMDLSGKVAVVEANTSFHSWLVEQNKTSFQKNPIQITLMNVNLLLEQLVNKQANFSIFDADSAMWITQNEYPQLSIAFPIGSMDQIGWMFRKSDKQLQKKVDLFFNSQRADQNSAINQIWKKYYGMDLIKFVRIISSID